MCGENPNRLALQHIIYPHIAVVFSTEHPAILGVDSNRGRTVALRIQHTVQRAVLVPCLDRLVLVCGDPQLMDIVVADKLEAACLARKHTFEPQCICGRGCLFKRPQLGRLVHRCRAYQPKLLRIGNIVDGLVMCIQMRPHQLARFRVPAPHRAVVARGDHIWPNTHQAADRVGVHRESIRLNSGPFAFVIEFAGLLRLLHTPVGARLFFGQEEAFWNIATIHDDPRDCTGDGAKVLGLEHQLCRGVHMHREIAVPRDHHEPLGDVVEDHHSDRAAAFGKRLDLRARETVGSHRSRLPSDHASIGGTRVEMQAT
eukprot:comp15828_c0_seq1/m.24586 comp15828_c0_seq1/g.24586  ORF comp15828_c0_seq1/g.24586 comp15828_c0_seq1/m.24586 type:complete len:314 (-) comp15828_c0_seq1:7-948(-)